ncbi:hypothetical protein C4N9_20520 [Pararhodobacter marinus]|uniref:Uncharacterized protein n=1 Tax=Pararhodobacter marinus TaxID=2184063 RepID=A0A2U2C478_9RHOB|nr:hypothetical protein [Pararhodobacter marinus]PWE26651.1 hypothetical protein C4N9_20520 [Pararhodobacter marinus]
MTKFSFANLLGGGQRSRAATEDDEQEKAEETEEESETENEEDQAEGEDGDDAAESDQDEARRAILAERGRIATILSSATPETVAQAAYFATQTDMTPAQAKKALAVAPQGSGGLAAKMRGRGSAPAPSPAAGRQAGKLPPELAAAQARRLNKEG